MSKKQPKEEGKMTTMQAFFAPRVATKRKSTDESPPKKKQEKEEEKPKRLRKNARKIDDDDDDDDEEVKDQAQPEKMDEEEEEEQVKEVAKAAVKAPEKEADKEAAKDEDEEEAEEEEEEEEEEVKKKKSKPNALLATLTNKKVLEVPDWAASGVVPFSFVAAVLDAIELTPKRLEIQRLLRDALAVVMTHAPKDFADVIFLVCAQVAPPYMNLELGVGDSLLQKAIAAAFGRSAKKVKEDYEKIGDLGDVALDARAKQRTLPFGAKPKPPSAAHVLKTFREIARIEGGKSGDLKIGKIQKLVVAASPAETKFIIRSLQGKLRVGLQESTVMVSIAQAAERWPPKSVVEGEAASLEAYTRKDIVLEAALKLRDSAQTRLSKAAATSLKDTLGGKRLSDEERLDFSLECVKSAFAESPNFTTIAEGILSKPLWALHASCALKVGIPLYPMLAKAAKAVSEVLKRLAGKHITCEHKYDGERVQCHLLEDGSVKVFSRNLQDTTQKWPELQAVMKEAGNLAGTTSAVIDAEIVAIDRESGNLLPFQRLSTRKKSEARAEDVTIQVIVKAFDCLLLNGRSLLREPFLERRRLMREGFSPLDLKFGFADSVDIMAEEDEFAAAETIGRELEAAITAKSEGLMVKTMGDTYEPSRRSLNWLKLKKDYLDGNGDSIDLVVVGAYHGKGKRTGNFGAYLLACYDAESEEFQTVCKLGTGFSDEALIKFDEECQAIKIDSKPRHVITSDGLAKDVTWLEPKFVWEVQCADLSLSFAHKGALSQVEKDRGIGLRFPRLVRARPDKQADEATSSEQILDMYSSQESVKNTASNNNGDDSDGDL